MRIRKFAVIPMLVALLTACMSDRSGEQILLERLSPPSNQALVPVVEALLYPKETLEPEIQAMVQAYAPRLWMHEKEQYHPTDPKEFVENSSLWLRHNIGRSDELITKKVDVAELGRANSGVYAREELKLLGTVDALRSPATVVNQASASELTNPENDKDYYLKYEGNPARVEDNAPVLWRMGLSPRSLGLGEAPQGQERVLIEYWYHIPYSYVGPFGVGNHQGDWEGIAVLVDLTKREGKLEHKMVAAFYAAHADGQWHCPDELSYEGTHPEAFSAKGTHATYNKAGSFRHFPIVDRTGRGRALDSWKNLRPMVREAYYGFAGRWGDRSVLPHSSGPTAPGARAKWLPNPNSAARKLQKCI